MTHTLTRFSGWSRDEWERDHREPLDDKYALDVMAEFIEARIREPYRLYPPVDFHLSFLTGEFRAFEPAAGIELADKIVRQARLVLADFQHSAELVTLEALLKVDAPLIPDLPLSNNRQNDVVPTLRYWREALPHGLFDKLCELNAADFAFYDRVVAQIVPEIPVSVEERQQIEETLKEAAEITGHRSGRRFHSAPLDTRSGRDRIVEADPVLGYRYRPHESFDQLVLGRRIIMETDAAGYRPVIGQPDKAAKSFAAYGCSFTYGFVIQAEETFCSVLQSMLPTWRIENHGINGYGTHQNLVQLQRDNQWELADYVAFCFIPAHLTRNVAAASCFRGFTRFMWQSSPVQFYPRACLEPDGAVNLRRIPIKRPELQGLDLDDFDPDSYYLDQVCFALFKRADEIVRAAGKHFFVVTLRNYPSEYLLGLMTEAGIGFLDAHVPWEPEYTCEPDDAHPNALANQIFAERIRDYLMLVDEA